MARQRRNDDIAAKIFPAVLKRFANEPCKTLLFHQINAQRSQLAFSDRRAQRNIFRQTVCRFFDHDAVRRIVAAR